MQLGRVDLFWPVGSVDKMGPGPDDLGGGEHRTERPHDQRAGVLGGVRRVYNQGLQTHVCSCSWAPGTNQPLCLTPPWPANLTPVSSSAQVDDRVSEEKGAICAANQEGRAQRLLTWGVTEAQGIWAPHHPVTGAK